MRDVDHTSFFIRCQLAFAASSYSRHRGLFLMLIELQETFLAAKSDCVNHSRRKNDVDYYCYVLIITIPSRRMFYLEFEYERKADSIIHSFFGGFLLFSYS